MISRFYAVLTLGLATFAPSLFATTYTGSDTACFGKNCTAVSGQMSTGFIDKDLSFTTASFSRTGNGDVTLGTFKLGSAPSIISSAFDLDVTFSAPTGATTTGDFDAWVAGIVICDQFGIATVTFSQPTTDVYNYPGGSFTLSLDQSSICLGPNGSANLTADVVGTSAAPEPMSMLLMGSGLGLLGLARFRKTVKA